MTGPAIDCRGVVVRVRAGREMLTVLRHVDLSIDLGGLTLIIGPSGCGKTTLLSVLGGILSATAGSVSVLGTELSSLGAVAQAAFRRDNIGFVFQSYNLVPTLSVVENVSIPLAIAGQPIRAAALRAMRMLEQLGLEEHADRLPGLLSGGQQQRVAIARALVHGPKLLLCDEPTAALDTGTGLDVMRLLRTMAVHPDRAVVIVTHDQRLHAFADTIATMDEGQVVSVAATSPAASLVA